MNLHYETKTELVDKMEALKIDINEADEKYQQALARGDFDTCGKYSNERAQYRRTFAKLLKYKMKRKWLWVKFYLSFLALHYIFQWIML